MLLRNRDLNVQAAARHQLHLRDQQQQKIQKRRGPQQQVKTGGAAADNDDCLVGGPDSKRPCNGTQSSLVPKVTEALCISRKDFAVKIQQQGEQSSDIFCASILKRQRQPFVGSSASAEDCIYDFDKANARDLTAVSEYAKDIFAYYKYRERFFRVLDYSSTQPLVMVVRPQVVNWMVELQESFELNHETLYLAVKLFDLFLGRTSRIVKRNEAQLIASTAIFVAAKFDEVSPPLLDDLIYMAEDAFDRRQMITTEQELLHIVDCDLGSPLSYRFLRRLSRVSRTEMRTLTLARYILETSLMSIEFCRLSDSLIAAACLLLAKRMRNDVDDWTPVLQANTGYILAVVEPVVQSLNSMLVRRKELFGGLDTTYRKYSHQVFFKVALVQPLLINRDAECPFATNKVTGQSLNHQLYGGWI